VKVRKRKFRPSLPRRAWFHALHELRLFQSLNILSKGVLRLVVQYYYLCEVQSLSRKITYLKSQLGSLISKGFDRYEFSQKVAKMLGRISKFQIDPTFGFYQGVPVLDTYVHSCGKPWLRHLFEIQRDDKLNYQRLSFDSCSILNDFSLE